MLIVCPSCASEYAIDPAYLRPAGRKLRCASCREIFFVDAPEDEEEDDSLNADWANGILSDDRAETAITVDAANGRSGAADGRQAKPPTRKSATKPRKRKMPAFLGTAGASLSRVPLALVVGVVVVGATIGALLGRESVVRSVPATALLYEFAGMSVNLRGLEIAGVTSSVSTEGNTRFLTIEGEISNPTGKPLTVPQIAIALWGESRQTLYSWSIEPPRAILSAGESTRFRARLVAPPDEARQVLVRFGPDADGATMAEGGR
jgi:predicted Zn finger-like uncharacterized protein